MFDLIGAELDCAVRTSGDGTIDVLEVLETARSAEVEGDTRADPARSTDLGEVASLADRVAGPWPPDTPLVWAVAVSVLSLVSELCAAPERVAREADEEAAEELAEESAVVRLEGSEESAPESGVSAVLELMPGSRTPA